MDIQPLTREHYHNLTGEWPVTTVKGVAVIDGEEVFALVATTIIAGENFIVFSSKPGFKKRDIIIGWKMFKKILNAHREYYVLIDRCLETAPSMLNHFKFYHFYDDIYVYRGE